MNEFSDFYRLAPQTQADKLLLLAQEARAAWGFGDDAELTLLKFRENAVFRVDAGDGRYAMRVHRAGYHSAPALASELRWMTGVRGAGVPTPRVVPARGGGLYAEVAHPDVPEPRLVDVLSWVDGDPLGSVEGGVAAGEDTTAMFRETGRLMARLHHHAEHWQRPADFTRHAWDAEGLLGDEPLWGRFWELEALDAGQRETLLTARDLARAALDDFGTQADRYGLIHADFLPENLLVGAEGVQLIDFDDAGFGWHLFDIATSLFVVVGTPEFDAVLDAFVSGYREERALPDAHLAHLPLFFLLRGLAYLGWLHTRRETSTAQEMTPVLVPAVTEAAAEFVAAARTRA